MLTLRSARREDAAALAAIYRSAVEGSPISFELTPPTPAELEQRLVAVTAHHPWLVCAPPDGPALGYAYGARHNERAAYQWAVNVTVYVRPDAHRRGIGRALYTALLALLRQQGFFTAHAGITLPNPASVGLHESFGFRPVGVYPDVGYKLGRWWDVGWWRLPLQPTVPAPAPPRPPADGTPAWQEALAAGQALLSTRSPAGPPGPRG